MNASVDNAEAQAQARAQLDSVREMVAALECDYERLQELRDERQAFFDPDELGDENNSQFDAWAAAYPEDAQELAELIDAAGDCEDADEARQCILDDALSVEVRSDWRAVGDEDDGPSEYRIVLCTGGPHVEIVGELRSGEPRSARLLYQDWGTPKTELRISGDDRDALIAYASVFCFGE